MGSLRSPFPTERLVPLPARHWARSGPCGLAAIHIPLGPFGLGSDTVQTAIRLDGIALELGDLRVQAGRQHRFATNPQEGYIDGSMYLQGRHVPVDVVLLEFGEMAPEGLLPLRLEGHLVFSAAGLQGWNDTPLVLATTLEAPPGAAQTDAAIALAVAATGAQALRDAGKVMGWLTRQHPHWEDRQALHQAVCRHLAPQRPPSGPQ
ncbi:hypothetical protein HNP48_005755 [Acidovorax soli]|uniref:Uncharacterized protein n=1 Tax=Acidovorax soli TaxID=592050 RepID=A0A7X0UCE7_9BURK|nr:hypothetical protein [Acidovorax soli]MBB6563038.1 hypothetical protein [Acidovorax soli]